MTDETGMLNIKLTPDAKLIKKLIFATMRRDIITKIEVSYSGGGDTGAIDCVYLYAGEKLLDEKVEFFVLTPEGKSVELRKLVEEFSYPVLQDLDMDWINNDGGSGTMEFEDGKIMLHHGQNETITTDYDYEVE
jgi:hypothetical protein